MSVDTDLGVQYVEVVAVSLSGVLANSQVFVGDRIVRVNRQGSNNSISRRRSPAPPPHLRLARGDLVAAPFAATHRRPVGSLYRHHPPRRAGRLTRSCSPAVALAPSLRRHVDQVSLPPPLPATVPYHPRC